MPATEEIVGRLTDLIINPILMVLFSAGFFLFVFGLVRFLLNLNDGKDREKSIKHMLWGIVGMLIMSSVEAILVMIDNTFGLHVFGGGPDISHINRAIDSFPGFK